MRHRLTALGRVGRGPFTAAAEAYEAGDTLTGAGLGEVLRLTPLPSGAPWLVVDQNGQVHRATDWGTAQVRASQQDRRWSEASLWYPAISFGDTCAASGALGVSIALRAFSRGYAEGSFAMVLSCEDGRERAMTWVHPAGRR